MPPRKAPSSLAKNNPWAKNNPCGSVWPYAAAAAPAADPSKCGNKRGRPPQQQGQQQRRPQEGRARSGSCYGSQRIRLMQGGI